MKDHPEVLIIEFGSQVTQLIGRVARDIGVRTVILEPKRALQWLSLHIPKAIILSGSDASVHDSNAPCVPADAVLKLRRADGKPVPVLGICYGMQLMTHWLGGIVKSESEHRSYGPDTIEITVRNALFTGTPERQDVWMSHGDSVIDPPPEFTVLATAASGAIAAIGDPARRLYGVQFHPEVTHTPRGADILSNFLLGIAGCGRNWIARDVIRQKRDALAEALGSHENAIFGFSGGVDSSTLAAIAAPALKQRVRAVTVDAGQLREGELADIEEHARHIGVELHVVDARDSFIPQLYDTVDAEEKRKRFRKLYSSCLQLAAQRFGARYLIQGTLAPDKIESGHTGGAVIKTHHNVGLDTGTLRQLHPLDDLFKHEVRDLARSLGLPECICEREPFPGPGLLLRINGTPVTAELLDTVRWADARVREILHAHGFTDFSQLIVALNGVPTVGVKGDGRAYRPSIVVRAVRTIDFMTASGVWFPEPIAMEIMSTLTKHPGITRTWFDPTHKPPGTTEFE